MTTHAPDRHAPPDGGALAQFAGVAKRFGPVVALDGIDLTVPAGQVLGLLGPNGAGKSTLISLLAGLLTPTAGQVTLGGRDPRHPAARAILGLTPQDTSLPGLLRVREVLDQVAAHYPDPLPVPEVLELLGLAELANRPTAKLSGGQRRRLSVALALIGRPRLIALDEPTTGLDTVTRSALWQVLRDVRAAGTTILLTSHYLEEIEALADRVVLIDRGHLLLDDSLAAVLGRVHVRHVTVTLAPADAVRLAALPGTRLAALPGGEGVPAGMLADDGAGLASAVAVRGLAGDGGSGPFGPGGVPSSGGDVTGTAAPVRFVVRDSDEFVRQLVALGVRFAGLTVRPTSLEEAIGTIKAHEEVAA